MRGDTIMIFYWDLFSIHARVLKPRPTRPRMIQRICVRLRITRPRRPRFFPTRFDFTQAVRGVRVFHDRRWTAKNPSEPSEDAGLDRLAFFRGRPTNLNAMSTVFAGKDKDPLPVLAVAGKDAAPEPAVWVDAQMFALPVLPAFGTGRAPCPHGAIG